MKLAKMPNGTPEIYGPVLQGEGMSQGTPVIFVRLSGCNLFCTWCDTYYTWNFEGRKYPKNHEYVPEQVKMEDFVLDIETMEVAEIISEMSGKCSRVVFSGGEPLMQQKSIGEIIEALKVIDDEKHWTFEIETNGTYVLKDYLRKSVDQINSSPKLASSGNLDKVRNSKEAIRVINNHDAMGGLSSFKFVIREDNFEDDIQEVISWSKEHEVTGDKIYLMPEGWEREEIINGTLALEERVKDLGFKVSTRMHILIHGDKRAV